MSDMEQFEKFLEKMEDKRNLNLRELLNAIIPIQSDRERLIRMEETMKNTMLLMNSMRTEDLLKIGDSNTKAIAAHRRIDSVSKASIIGNMITIGGMILT